MMISSLALLASCCENNYQRRDRILTIHKRQIIVIDLFLVKNKKVKS